MNRVIGFILMPITNSQNLVIISRPEGLHPGCWWLAFTNTSIKPIRDNNQWQ
ncbi:hypothetical protein [Paraflavitalea speifideaquila]|uniref:hypothetical protein n=1 Tax=Paraflavitalea speifideaquila TaxID=3076558 RepID=UPI0028EBE9D5|nr:hypothetical protein [Paraflavitalea speifideiaquila]